MTKNSRGRGGRPFTRLKKQVAEEEPWCAKCGGLIDDTLPVHHPMSRTLGHIVPLALGGEPYDRENAQAEHLHCNAGDGSRIAALLRPPKQHTTWVDVNF